MYSWYVTSRLTRLGQLQSLRDSKSCNMASQGFEETKTVNLVDAEQPMSISGAARHLRV
jgi:hypothetical protein